MAYKAHRRLLESEGRRTGETPADAEESYAAQVEPWLGAAREVGNTYTASLYLCLAWLADQAASRFEGKRIGLFSYGSGCCAEFFTGGIVPGAAAAAARIGLADLLQARRELSVEEYETFARDGAHGGTPPGEDAGFCHLAAVRDDKRIYERRRLFRLMEFSAQQQRTPSTVDAAYRHCWRIARSHYENFTVGSWLLPRRLRRHIAAIYAFARTADDIADEGAIDAPERLARLDAWEHQLEECYRGRRLHPIFVALGDTADRFELPIDPFRKLLRAFRADAEFKPFDTFDTLLEYCRCSADPVGHLILYLFGYRDPGRQQLADQICTGLQLANFWQDIAIDAAKGRVYVPLEDLARFGCSADDVKTGVCSPAVRELMRFEVDRARGMLTRGLELAAHVDRRLAREVCLFAWGGLAILRAIEAVDYDVFTRRPTLSKRAKAEIDLARAGDAPDSSTARPHPTSPIRSEEAGAEREGTAHAP